MNCKHNHGSLLQFITLYAHTTHTHTHTHTLTLSISLSPPLSLLLGCGGSVVGYRGFLALLRSRWIALSGCFLCNRPSGKHQENTQMHTHRHTHSHSLTISIHVII